MSSDKAEQAGSASAEPKVDPKKVQTASAGLDKTLVVKKFPGGADSVGPVIAPLRSTPATAQTVGPAKPALPSGIRPPAARATIKRRHRLALYSFLLIVLLPFSLLAGYLATFAQNQFASEAGFSVRKDESSASVDMIGGLTQLTGSASTDAEILYDYIRSPDLVAKIDKDLDLHGIFGRKYDQDPLFSLAPGSTIEEKTDYWRKMIIVEYNESTGLIRLEVRAFTAQEAQKIGQAIIDYSSQMINRLSDAARDDATRYARAELDKSIESLRTARAAITEFRSRTQIIDPLEDIRRQSNLLNNLEAQLADALIQLDTLRATVTVARSPQIEQTELRIELIRKRIEEERAKVGIGPNASDENKGYAQTVAEFERLVVDREVAEERFRSTTLLYNAAQAEADRKSRYLAAHVAPTLAESPLYPSFFLILLMAGTFLGLVWSLLILVYYSIRDRR